MLELGVGHNKMGFTLGDLAVTSPSQLPPLQLYVISNEFRAPNAPSRLHGTSMTNIEFRAIAMKIPILRPFY